MIEDDSEAPLIVTARMDEDSFAYFDKLRAAHFPRERNFLTAHLTLFHKLPSREIEKLSKDIADLASVAAVIEIEFSGWRSLGRGVAMNVSSESLASVRAELARRWEPYLTPQDRQAFRPHITVQNKVDPTIARQLLEELSQGSPPAKGYVTGFEVWRYLDGPWEIESYTSLAR